MDWLLAVKLLLVFQRPRCVAGRIAGPVAGQEYSCHRGTRYSQGILNIFDFWANPSLFDARLDFAVREWARRSTAVADEVRRADSQRLAAITYLFTRLGAGPRQAIIQAGTLYFMQLG